MTTKLVVGLGNTGKQYLRTRHNVGFLVVDALARDFCLDKFSADKKSKSEITQGGGGHKVIFAKPQTFMNESGIAVRALVDFYKLKPASLIVIHDDKDIPLGEWRIQTDRGPAGHNGVKSIIEHLGTQNFTRVRVGVAPPAGIAGDTSDFVLQKFSKEEQKIIDATVAALLPEVKKLL